MIRIISWYYIVIRIVSWYVSYYDTHCDMYRIVMRIVISIVLWCISWYVSYSDKYRTVIRIGIRIELWYVSGYVSGYVTYRRILANTQSCHFQTWTSWRCRPCVTAWSASCWTSLVPSSRLHYRPTWFTKYKVSRSPTLPLSRIFFVKPFWSENLFFFF